MLTLQGDTIFLRALEPEDLEFIYQIENDESIWEVSNTQTPYSRFLIKQYLENAHLDIYEAKQLRLVICDQKTESTLGLIDLFDFEPMHHRAGVGILIGKNDNRGKGYGTEALNLIISYAEKHLALHQLYANIAADNKHSIELFEKAGFQQVGIKKDWNLFKRKYKDEILYQLLYVH